MLALQILAGTIGYFVIGGCTSAHAVSTYERHGENCQNCSWQIWGVFWPIYWFGQMLAIAPYRRTMRYIAGRKLPKARLLKDGKTDGLG